MNKIQSGTLFRFPFRNALTAAESEISKTQYAKGDAIDELFQTFKKTIPKVLLFLRHVKRIEVYTEGAEDHTTPQLLYYADVAEQKAIPENISDNSDKCIQAHSCGNNLTYSHCSFPKGCTGI